MNNVNPFVGCLSVSDKRSTLCYLTHAAKEQQELMRATGAQTIPHINWLLVQHFKKISGAKEFKTYREWAKEGRQVQKGAKAWVVWSTPRHKKVEDEKGEKVEVGMPFFGLCFLFSDLDLK